MKQYQDLLEDILHNGIIKRSRSGSTKAVFGRMLSFDLDDGFPAITVKKLHFSSVAGEIAGFLRAENDAAKMGSSIWLADAARWHRESEYSNGPTDMGRVYGALWRSWDNRIDQLRQVVTDILENPNSRRMIVSAWNPSELKFGCLPPCTTTYQFFVRNDYLDVQAYQRSCDCFLGLPFNIAGNALLNCIVANETGFKPGRLTIALGDAHIYLNHLDKVDVLLDREPFPLPKLALSMTAKIDNFHPDMASLINYESYPSLHAPLNVGDE